MLRGILGKPNRDEPYFANNYLGEKACMKMSGFYVLLAVVVALMVSGCSTVVFRNGLPASQPLKADKALLGYWDVEGGSIVCTTRTNGLMDIVLIEQSGNGVKVTRYESYPAKVGSAQYLCVRPVNTDKPGKPETQDEWLILNYRTGWRSVSFKMLRTEPFRDLVRAGKLEGEIGGSNVTITATPKELAGAFAAMGADTLSGTNEWIKIWRGR